MDKTWLAAVAMWRPWADSNGRDLTASEAPRDDGWAWATITATLFAFRVHFGPSPAPGARRDDGQSSSSYLQSKFPSYYPSFDYCHRSRVPKCFKETVFSGEEPVAHNYQGTWCPRGFGQTRRREPMFQALNSDRISLHALADPQLHYYYVAI